MRNLVILALAVPAAFGLQVKTDAAFGLEEGLDGIPQKLAKIFALAAVGKVTNEMVDTELQDIFDKSHGLADDKRMQLAKVVKDMFPEDAVDLEEVVELKYSPVGQSFLQMSSAEGEGLGEKEDILEKDDWDPWDDEWKKKGMDKPSMRGPWEYRAEGKLEKNLRRSEEQYAKDNCLPDGALSCYTKDITYMPCRTFNLCMAIFNKASTEKFNMYADNAGGIAKAASNFVQSKKAFADSVGICNAANQVTLPTTMENPGAQEQSGEGQVDTAHRTSLTSRRYVNKADRLPCSVAWKGNPTLARMSKELKEVQGANQFFKHANGNDAKKEKHHELQMKKAMEFEVSREAGKWATNPIGMLEHTVGGKPTPDNVGQRLAFLPRPKHKGDVAMLKMN